VFVILVALVGSYAFFGLILGWLAERLKDFEKEVVSEAKDGAAEVAVLGREPPQFFYLDKILGAVMGRRKKGVVPPHSIKLS